MAPANCECMTDACRNPLNKEIRKLAQLLRCVRLHCMQCSIDIARHCPPQQAVTHKLGGVTSSGTSMLPHQLTNFVLKCRNSTSSFMKACITAETKSVATVGAASQGWCLQNARKLGVVTMLSHTSLDHTKSLSPNTNLY